jgi:hypothetical protein
MIDFKCPECGEPMEIGDRMAGQQVRCVGCDEWVDVPQRRARRRRVSPDRMLDDDEGLSGGHWALFGVLFAVVPIVNVIVSSVLYYAWRSTKPRSANQINLLGFLIFGLHILIGILVGVLTRK